jgi:hypothetical protein
MPYVSSNPKQFATVMTFLNIEINGDPSAEEIALYTWVDSCIDVAYDEAESYCGQPLRSTSVPYVFNASKSMRAQSSDIYWKFIPYFANTTLTSFQHRTNEFSSYVNVDAQNYSWSTEPSKHYIVYRGINTGQFRATLSTGYTDATMPKTILQGIAEMVSLLYKQSAMGGNWFGLTSIVSGGAGQNVSQSLKMDINWQKYFGTYYMPPV